MRESTIKIGGVKLSMRNFQSNMSKLFVEVKLHFNTYFIYINPYNFLFVNILTEIHVV